MRALGNGKYEITNTSTGEKRIVNQHELGSYGLSAPDQKSDNGGVVRGVSDFLRGIGLGAFPDAAAALSLLPQRLTKGKGLSDEEAANNPFISVDQLHKIKNEGQLHTVKNAAGVASWLYGPGELNTVKELPLVGNLLAKLAPGAISGGLQGFSQDNATPGSVATSAVLGSVVPKLLGLVAHPIKPFIDSVNNTVANSAKTVDVGELLRLLHPEVVGKFERDTVGSGANEAYNNIASDILSSVQQRIPHELVENTPSGAFTGNVNTSTLPLSEVNNLKRDLYSSVNKYFGQDTGKLDIEMRKLLGHHLKNVIEQAEPDVKLPNTMASLLYKFPHTAEGLSYVIPGMPSQGRALLRGVGSLPARGVQAVIPADGGYLQRLFPSLYNLMNSGTSSN